MIMIVCFFGNTLVCVCVYRDKHLRTVPNLFIVNLAITNMLLSSTVWPFWSVALTTGKWSSTQAACNFQGFQNHCLMTSLTLTIAALGLNRYIMLVYPFHYRILFKRQNAYKILVVQWFLSMFWGFLRFAHLGGYEFVPAIGLCASCAEKLSSVIDISLLILTNVLTLFCYYKVFTIIRKHISSVLPQGSNAPWPPATGPKAYYYEEVNFTKTSMLIFFAYGLSWSPLIFFALLLLSGVHLPRNALLTSWFLVAFSCATHPIINIASNKRFRREFYRVLCSCGFDYEANATTRLDGEVLPAPGAEAR